MRNFDKLIEELDQVIATNKTFGLKCVGYSRIYFTTLTDQVLAGIQIFLPPTYEGEGRLLYISTQMKVWFGEIATAIDPEECKALGIPEEHPLNVRAGVYGGFRVAGQKGFRSLLSLATNDSLLRNATLGIMPSGIEPLGTRAFHDLEREYEMT